MARFALTLIRRLAKLTGMDIRVAGDAAEVRDPPDRGCRPLRMALVAADLGVLSVQRITGGTVLRTVECGWFESVDLVA